MAVRNASGERQEALFLNVGGYHPSTLAELHAFDFFVANDASEAKAKALASLLNGAQQHKDNLKEVEGCLLLDALDGLYVHLVPNPAGEAYKSEWQGYQPIGI